MRIMGRILGRGVCVLALAWAVGLLGLVLFDQSQPDSPALPASADAILCLGGGMSYQGWQEAGPASTRRALSCAELYRAGVAPLVLFTGYGHQQDSAAAAMARLAQEVGVPAGAILLEEDARSTLQNAVYGLALLPAGTERVVIVTDGFHIPRSWVIFHSLGAPEAQFYPARTIYTRPDGLETLSRGEWILRESVVVWVNVGRLAVYGATGLLGIPVDTRADWFN